MAKMLMVELIENENCETVTCKMERCMAEGRAI